MADQHKQAEDAFLEGFHGIPDLNGMSFKQLAAELASSKPGTAKFIIVENTLLRHEESALKENTISSAKVGGRFSLAGVILGVVLTFLVSNFQPAQKIICQFGDVEPESSNTQ